MNKTIKAFALLLFIFIGQTSFAQINEKKAHELAMEALTLMDAGKFEESITLLKKAAKLDPDNANYPYETAYAHYAMADYKGASKLLKKAIGKDGVTDKHYQLLGNCEDMMGDPEKAFDAYNAGLAVFPNSGIIHLEKGNMFLARDQADQALPYYEKGIELDPEFPSNYYRAALIYLASTEEVWGMLYGEIFMNLERNSARTAEISKLLYDTYTSEIKILGDTSYSVSFSQSMTFNINSMEDLKNFKLPFGALVYEPILMMSLLEAKTIDINSLDVIRTTFLKNYYAGDHDTKYPNALFDYQKKVEDAGHLEAYNHWILMQGDVEAFEAWQAENEDKLDAFIEWFNPNGLVLSNTNKFYKAQY